MIDAVDDATRSRERPCNADFWLAVQKELLPQARNLTPFTDDTALTVVAGQSYGGLSALYAGFTGRSDLAVCLPNQVLSGGQT